MKQKGWRRSRWAGRWLAGVVTWGLASIGHGEETEAAKWIDGCRRNLQLIHDALVTHQREHEGKWPARLSDLAGRYVPPEVLVCPRCYALGVYSLENTSLINTMEDDPQTVYKYELHPRRPAPGLGEHTWLQWKEGQRRTAVGDAVPMVRCDQHMIDDRNVHLNLSFGGDVYVSGVYWEESFRDQLPLPYLTNADQIGRSTLPIPERVPPRPAGATGAHVDLGPAATALPRDPWQDGTSNDTLAGLLEAVSPDGLWHHEGVSFDVRALVQLDGRRGNEREVKEETGRSELYYPTSPRVIQVGAGGRRLHIMGGVVFPAPEGSEVGGLLVRYTGGGEQRIPWRYGIEVRDGWYDKSVGEEEKHRAWTAESFDSDVNGVPTRRGPLAVYHWVVELNQPGQVIESLQFFSSATQESEADQFTSGPFLLAVTVEGTPVAAADAGR
jgi:hypothetical protein